MPTHPRPVALVTGAGTGIGRAACRALARDGHDLALVGRRPAPLSDLADEITTDPAAERPAAEPFPTDIADVANAAPLISRVLEHFGRLDALVNNAGWSPLAPIAEQSAETIRAVVDVNATGPLALIAAALPALLDAPAGGVVVNVSSVATFDPFPGLGVYAAAKCAMNGVALALRNEYADRGLRAYAVAPGAVETPLLRSLFDEAALPPDRTLDPADVAEVIAACVAGRTDADNGSTVRVDSPR